MTDCDRCSFVLSFFVLIIKWVLIAADKIDFDAFPFTVNTPTGFIPWLWFVCWADRF